MDDNKKTKNQLISELNKARKKIHELEAHHQEHENTEHALFESEQRYKTIIENSPLGIISIDKTGKILTVNDSLIQILGSPSIEATMAINVLSYVPMIEARIADALIQCMETRKNMISEHPYRTKWRKDVYFKLHLAPICASSGEVTGCEAIVEDISENKKNEEDLKISEECFRAIADYTYHWESWFGTDGSLLWVNPAVERVTGYSVDECHNMIDYPLPIVHKNDRKILLDLIENGWSDYSDEEVVFRIKHRNNSIVWISMAWQKVYSSENEDIGLRTSFHNITALKKGKVNL